METVQDGDSDEDNDEMEETLDIDNTLFLTCVFLGENKCQVKIRNMTNKVGGIGYYKPAENLSPGADGCTDGKLSTYCSKEDEQEHQI